MSLEHVIRKTLELPEETPLSDADGPGSLEGWDSLGHIRLLKAVQDEFGVQFDADEIMGVSTLADLKDLLKRKGAAGM